MSILFENKKSKKDKINTNISKIYSALKIALSDFKISDSEIAKKIFVYELKSLDNSSKNEKQSKSETDDAEVDFSDYGELNEAKKAIENPPFRSDREGIEMLKKQVEGMETYLFWLCQRLDKEGV